MTRPGLPAAPSEDRRLASPICPLPAPAFAAAGVAEAVGWDWVVLASASPVGRAAGAWVSAGALSLSGRGFEISLVASACVVLAAAPDCASVGALSEVAVCASELTVGALERRVSVMATAAQATSRTTMATPRSLADDVRAGGVGCVCAAGAG